ncbi:shikimate dehydrogenase family protein [Capnocytophaga canimorsus]|uniref:shikimate dehydrogenase family protein n=1 Tax=Capnocytophaga canimorsus TaxID=28188 RepID=UPI0037D86F9E
MEKNDKKNLFALIGKNIDYSFSRAYFSKKFQEEGINAEYVNFDLMTLEELPSRVAMHPNLKGMNVTIPYKEAIISKLAALNETAKIIGAVNTIKVTPLGWIGFNTDYYGFSESIKPFLKPHHTKALILGTGGASKAVAYALKTLSISYRFVSRTPKIGQYAYTDLSAELLSKYTIIINCTPLGTFPNVTDCPPIPYQHITSQHLLYDLIYNPEKTLFLQKGEQKKATICNGEAMLRLQAEKAWEIWNS